MTDKLTPGHQEDAKKIIEFVGSVKPIEVMTDKDKKLAEEILVKRGFFVMTHKVGSEHVRKVFIDPVIEAMQEYAESYHTAKMQGKTSGKIETPEYEKAVLDYLENGINYDCPAFTPHFKKNYLEQFVFDTWFAAIKWERGKTDHSAKMRDVTDEDICNHFPIGAYASSEWQKKQILRRQGAKAMRNGEIKHKEG
ncbi:MAG: hypothetical protein ABFD04_00195 [Syntrophomonas sp.]